MKLKHFLLHIKTILKHKWYVFLACKDCGIIWRGIKHDISKLSPAEFLESAQHYTEGKTPLAVIKEKYGYSKGWLHHKGRNTHHWAYWIYLDTCANPVTAIKMPFNDVVEMICDWVGASKVYAKETWTKECNLLWYLNNKDQMILHPDTRLLIEEMLNDLKQYGWETIAISCKLRNSGMPVWYEWY